MISEVAAAVGRVTSPVVPAGLGDADDAHARLSLSRGGEAAATA